jgi:hypothetical protein
MFIFLFIFKNKKNKNYSKTLKEDIDEWLFFLFQKLWQNFVTDTKSKQIKKYKKKMLCVKLDVIIIFGWLKVIPTFKSCLNFKCNWCLQNL